jgi:hypothetical protein
VIKHNFDQTPILLETFDQVIRSSEIRSSDPLSLGFLSINKIPRCTMLKIPKSLGVNAFSTKFQGGFTIYTKGVHFIYKFLKFALGSYFISPPPPPPHVNLWLTSF